MKGIKVLCVVLLCSVSVSVQATSAVSTVLSKTGASVKGMQRFEAKFSAFLKKWQVPGASLAVRNAAGEVVYARGFGWADKAHKVPVQPDSQFRIAEVSKLFTAVAVLQLVEQGRLRLEDTLPSVLSNMHVPPEARVDKRIANITVRHLLEMRSGWDPHVAKGLDPFEPSQQKIIAAQLKVPVPLSCQAAARYMLTQPLQFKPGTHYRANDLNYCFLGLMIARVTGQAYGAASYMHYLREHILRPLHLDGVQLGQTLARQRAPMEVHYYSYPGEPSAPSLLVGHRGQSLSPAYGGSFYLPHRYATSGLVASAVDLVVFAYALDKAKLLKPTTLATLLERPKLAKGRSYQAKGVRVYRNGSRLAWSQQGRFSGSASYVARRTDGTYWAVLFNSLPKDKVGFYRAYKQLLEPGVVRVVSLAKKQKTVA